MSEYLISGYEHNRIYNFFEDVCTVKELQDISQRLRVAQMLDEGKSYQEVSRETGASTATISRVNKCLVYGNGGYNTVMKRFDDKTWCNEKAKQN